MDTARRKTLVALGAGLGCLVMGGGALAIVGGFAAWSWLAPKATSIRFEGPEAEPARSRAPLTLRRATVLDQHGERFEAPLAWSVSPGTVAFLRDNNVMPVGDGTATVTATAGAVTASYTIQVDVPPDYSGWWVAASEQGGVRAATYVHAQATGPDIYASASTLVFRRGQDERRFGMKSNARFADGKLCEDSPILIPLDAPLPATTGCSTLEAEGTGLLTFRSPEAGTYVLRRMEPKDFAEVASEVPANLTLLRERLLAFGAQNGRYVEAGSPDEARRQLGVAPARFESYTGFSLIGFEPMCCAVRSAYWVTAAGRTFEAHGVIDADGDGTPAEWVATESLGPRRVSPDGVW
jgi:hypothetical protein